MEADLIDQGVELMLFGMGTVALFLSLLVLVTTFMSFLTMRFFPEAPPQDVAPARSGQVSDSHLLAVISAAIHQHRSR